MFSEKLGATAPPQSPLSLAFDRLDARLDMLFNQASQLRAVTDYICGAQPETPSTPRPQAVPNGLADRVDERAARIEFIASSLANDLNRLNSL
jgi:hypothetical protein